MLRWLRVTALLSMCLLVLVGCGTELEKEKVKSVTVIYDGHTMSVPEDDPAFEEMAETVEDALGTISDVYEETSDLSSFEELTHVLIIELEQPQTLKISTWDVSDELEITHVAVPLAGDSFEKQRMIAAGADDGKELRTFKTHQTHLNYLRKQAVKYLGDTYGHQ